MTADFEEWWEKEGQFCRAGGGQYEKSFAWAAWNARQASAPPGFKILKDTTLEERSWPEDYEHENGNYFNKCHHCLRQFMGHKRRVTCKVCSER